LHPDIFDVEVNSLVINGLSALDFLAGKAVNLGTLFIDEPEIHVYHEKFPTHHQMRIVQKLFMNRYQKMSAAFN
jgi:hypothetical protein